MKNFFAFPNSRPLLNRRHLLILFLCITLFSACARREMPVPGALSTDDSYAFGILVATMLDDIGFSGLSFDYNAFMEGFRNFNEGEETRFTLEGALERVTAVFSMRNLEEGEAYLAANAQRPGVAITASGLQYEVIVQGTGERPTINDVVIVHYEGTFTNGMLFDSSFRRGAPMQISVGSVIPGWTEGLQLMNAGSTYRFVIPSDLAYGPQGWPGIPPNATLVFVVELIDIVR